ncbi:MAG: FRG domain-containing protein [Saprospiraceae bacterium]
MHSIKYKNYKEFKLKFKDELLRSSGKKSIEGFLFRGQADSRWKLRSSFDRIEQDKSKYDILIKTFTQVCKKYNYNEELLKSSKKEKNILAAFAQHYGLPTRLLDWTNSYYFAAFFAYAETIPGTNGECTIWAINQDSILEAKAQGLEFIKLSTNKFNYRIKNQLGHFTLSKHTEDSINEYETKIRSIHGIDDLLWRFDIKYKKNELGQVLSDLNDMGITYSVVYPDLEGYIKESMFRAGITK